MSEIDVGDEVRFTYPDIEQGDPKRRHATGIVTSVAEPAVRIEAEKGTYIRHVDNLRVLPGS